MRYAFDNVMSQGLMVLMLYLFLLTGLIVSGAAAIFVWIGIKPSGPEDVGYLDIFWMSFMRTLDPGTMSDDAGWGFRASMLLVTLIGIFIISTLIGLVSTSILAKINKLRKGRSFVVEKGHVLILGWSPKIYTIISELVIANENQKNPRIVILAEKDKVEMEDEIREKVGITKNTKVICRSGNPIDITDLQIVNPSETKSIIILDQETENSDSEIIKSILAITSNPQERTIPYHITAEIKDQKNYEVAKMVGKGQVELILSEVLIAMIMVQTGRQSGLSVVYTELLDFSGDEIYFTHEPQLVGKSFSEAIIGYEDSAIIGLQTADGEVKLNPPLDWVLTENDKVIAITEDDDTIVLSGIKDHQIDKDAITKPGNGELPPEKILVLGWNERAEMILNELNNYVIKDSRVKVVCSKDKTRKIEKRIKPGLDNITLEFEVSDITDRKDLERLEPITYDHLILLSNEDTHDIQESDAQTLITLLHLRSISDDTGRDLNIVSEMLDVQNRKLAEITKADDFIVSDELISLVLSQVAENKFLMRVFEELFGSRNCGIYINPVQDYVQSGLPLNFYTVLESARQKGQIAIGYRIMAYKGHADKEYGVVVNPKKSELIRFTSKDKIIVLS